MLTVPTVFVLGAGASAPFGFPTGWGLSRLVYEGLGPAQPGNHILHEVCGFAPEKIEDFRMSLFHSGRQSVDAFLEHRPDLMRIGKAAMAQALIRFEMEEMLFAYNQSNWLREMLSRLNTTFDDFAKNRLSFITFNYDRTVEHFLFSSLQNSYKKSDKECAAVLVDIPVIHLHGTLGFLPWQKSKDTRPYAVDTSAESLTVSMDSIKVIHEDISDGRDDDFKRAKSVLGDAEQIVLMGFGYNSKNIERLGIADLPDGKAIGTCQGLGPKGEDATRSACNGRVKLINSDCTDVIRELVNWQ